MRLGANIFGYKNAADWARIHVEKGYGAAYWPLGVNATAAEENEYIKAASDAGLIIAEVGIWNNMLDADPEKRKANFDYAVKRLETAERVGARCCVNISGSHSTFWDGPHMKNLTQETFDTIVEQSQRLIDAVKPQKTSYTLEPMPWMYPHDEMDVVRLMKAIDRKAFRVHADMANLVNSYDKFIATGEMTRKFFDTLGENIVSVHVKDTWVSETELTLHIEEAIPGKGAFDFGTLFTCCDKLDRDLPMMLEHLETAEEYDEAAANVKRMVSEMGLAFVTCSR